MEVKAKLKFIRTSPKKIRLVVDLVRGLDALEAVTQLQFSKKDSALPLAKLIKSAIANAEENDELKANNLYIKELFADGGPTLKRWMPRAMGRATPIRKRSSHITLVLAEKVPTQKKDKVKKEASTDDIIKIEDLGNISSGEKKEDKKSNKASQKIEGKNADSGKKGLNKIFNRTGNK